MSFPKAIHMETDPQTISAYLIYLSQHAPVGEQGLHNDLALVRVHLSHKRCGIDLMVDDYDTVRVMRVFALRACVCVHQDVARLIVERSTIMNSLFSKHSYRPESDATLISLISIFSTYICRMRKTKEGEDLYSWVSTTKFRIIIHSSGNSPLVYFILFGLTSCLHAGFNSPSLRIRCFCAGQQEKLLQCTYWWFTPWSFCSH